MTPARTLHVEGLGDFLELYEQYYGMWLASHAQLREIMAHLYWDKETALAIPLRHNGMYPERTNWMFWYVNVPAGYRSRSVVQYNAKTLTLEPRTRIVHLQNGYSVQKQEPLSKIPLALALE